MVSAGLGALVFANAYFANNGVVWQILDPGRMLAALAWAAGASQVNVAAGEGARAFGLSPSISLRTNGGVGDGRS